MGRRPKVSRQEVLRAARQAFSERGFGGTTLAAIATRAGVSPAALLRHEPTKQALFTAAMRAGDDDGAPSPAAFLAELDPAADPRIAIGRLARAAVPYIEARISEHIAQWMGARVLRLPVEPPLPPPSRAFTLVEQWVRRAAAAGALRVSDPQAAALHLVGSLHAFVFLQRVLRVPDPPLPLDRYLDTLIEVWTRGAVRASPRRKRR